MLPFISLLTIILSVILIITKGRVNKNTIFLSAAILLYSIFAFVHHVILFGKNPFWIAVFFNHLSPLNLLIGPCIFFYVRGTLNDRQSFSFRNFLHLIPAFLFFVGIIPWIFKPFGEKLEVANMLIANPNTLLPIKGNWVFTPESAYIIRTILPILYVCECLKLLSRFSPKKAQLRHIPMKQYKLVHRWILMLLIAFLISMISYFILSVSFILIDLREILSNQEGLIFFTECSSLFINFLLLFNPQVLDGMPRFKPNHFTENQNRVSSLSKNIDLEADSNEEPFVELAIRIQHYLTESKPYTNPDFSVQDLSNALNVPLNHISYCLHNILKTKFTTIRMKCRIDYAKELIIQGMNNEFTIEALALKSGFTTRSNFYSAFKQETGITPTEFIKTIEPEKGT
jgi:AraC-like DNA-binding protein